MKATIVGVGKMGLPIAWAMQKLGFDLQLIESNKKSFSKINKILGARPQEPIHADQIDGDSDVVISCLPYFSNQGTIEQIVYDLESSIPYCDLGGNPDMSFHIKRQFGGKLPIFTDLGLAPGFINIMAEDIVEKHGGENVVLRCGGLPNHKVENTLNYARVFSVEGLTNEYSGMCDVIKNGEIKQVPALSDVETWELSGEHFEAFHTKGASNGNLKSMLNRGVKNFCYKTIRLEGHVKLIKFLMEECKITGDHFSRAIKYSCPRTTNDRVFIEVETESPSKSTSQSMVVYADERWTAMQKCTAFPTAAVAAIRAKNKEPKVWEYADVPIEEFLTNLKTICGSEDKYREDELQFRS